ncbi:MAG: hypothetical protein QM786_13030 [Breznakibacter sp.]
MKKLFLLPFIAGFCAPVLAQTDSTIHFNADVNGKWNFYNDFSLWGNKTFYTDGLKALYLKNTLLNSTLEIAISECAGCYHGAASSGDAIIRKAGSGKKLIIGHSSDANSVPQRATGILGSVSPDGLWVYNNGNTFLGNSSETPPVAKLQVGGSQITTGRLQVGNTNDGWINSPIAGWTNGFEETDAALFVPLSQGEVSDLRLYIPDNVDDSFSVWGNTCTGGDCKDLNKASRVARFRGDGHVSFSGNVGIGLGDALPDQRLVVDGIIRAEEVKVETVNTATLNVEGGVYAGKIKVAANGQTADFVFEEGYDLKDLTEVERYINEHKHLPGIPGATQMEADGVDLAEMNKLLLQKVEELTMYLLIQEKRIKKLEQSR